mmetsp:Transcript_112206/g.317127  ORF Transcript_112206/g.317127 Transcript_112206/m.317127 type:complete len:208 (+) Transcript_112206:528-1151(+)
MTANSRIAASFPQMRRRRLPISIAEPPPSSKSTNVLVSFSRGNNRSPRNLGAFTSGTGMMVTSSRMSASGTLKVLRRPMSRRPSNTHLAYSWPRSRSWGKPARMSRGPTNSKEHCAAAAARRIEGTPCGPMAHSTSTCVHVLLDTSAPKMSSSSAIPSCTSATASASLPLQRPGQAVSEAAMTRKAQALRWRSEPMMASTLEFFNHA